MDSSYHSKKKLAKKNTIQTSSNLAISTTNNSNSGSGIDSTNLTDTDEPPSSGTGGSSGVSAKKKWKCPQCTYDNWQSSLKCTICLTPKSVLKAGTAAAAGLVHTSPSHHSPHHQYYQTSPSNSSSSLITSSNPFANSASLKKKTNAAAQVTSNKKSGTSSSSSTSARNSNIVELVSYETGGASSRRKSNTNSGSDTYKIENLTISKTSSSTSVSSEPQQQVPSPVSNQLDVDDSAKWSCSTCTYLNWPKSLKCVQCYTIKPPTTVSINIADENNNSSSSSSSSNNGDFIKTVRNGSSSPKNLTPMNRSLCNSPCTVPKQQSPALPPTDPATTSIGPVVSTNSNSNLSEQCTGTIVTVNEKKWQCSACTYQNWPKSQKCVMCHVPRQASSSMGINSSGSSGSCSGREATKASGKSQRVAQQSIHQQQQQLRLLNYQIHLDRLFLAACQSITESGALDPTHLHLYIQAGGDLTRKLTAEECSVLAQPHLFSPGFTLLHLCCRFKRKDVLINLLNQPAVQSKLIGSLSGSGTTGNSTSKVVNALLKQVNNCTNTKFSPCQSSPQMASAILERYFSTNLRQRRAGSTATSSGSHIGAMGTSSSPSSSLISLNNHHSPSPSPPPTTSGACGLAQGATSLLGASLSTTSSSNLAGLCYFVNESHTFTLPSEIEDLAPKVQTILFDELLDRDVQQELEHEGGIINWNVDLCKRLNGRLYPLWNRHSGDCLLDSVLQACYGVFDTDNLLRRVMAESLEQFAGLFKPRWKEHECLMARALNYRLDDYQLEHDWTNIISLANQPGSSLEQAHIFALCHIFRRPIIVYSVKYVKSFRGENIGFAHFEGVYLPLIWEPSFCFKNPIALGYTRGHFTALVPLDRAEIFAFMPPVSGTTSASQGPANSSSSSSSSNPVNSPLSSGPNPMSSNSSSNIMNGTECNISPMANSGNNPSTSANQSTNPTIATNSSTNISSSTTTLGAMSNLDYESISQQLFYLPLTNSEGHLLPVHFLTSSEIGRERAILRQYLDLDCLVMPGSGCGLLVAKQRVAKRGILVKQMLDEWLSYYRSMQAKEIGQPIEVIRDSDSDEHLIIGNNFVYSTDDNEYNDDDDDDDDEDDDDDDDDEFDDDEDEDNEYCEEVNVQ